MNEYIMIFHDNRDLYSDIMIKLKTDESDYVHLYTRFKCKTKELISSLYDFGDGDWTLADMVAIDELDVIKY